VPAGRQRRHASDRHPFTEDLKHTASAMGASSAVREKISFVPHPKTLTAAGELEYFAARVRHQIIEHVVWICPPSPPHRHLSCCVHARVLPLLECLVPPQGHHPMAFALAELVDNSLRATRGHTTSDRNIRVTLVLHPERPEGLVTVSRWASGIASSLTGVHHG